MDLLPKHMCHRCSYKLEEFHKFYVDCLKTDEDLKSQLSWMRTEAPKERVGVPMVHIENVKIKIEPLDYDAYEMNHMDDNVNYINSMNSVTFPPNNIPYATYARCRCCCDKMDQSNQSIPANYETAMPPRCNKLNAVRANGSGHADEMQAVKKIVVANKMCQEHSDVTMHDKRINKELRNSRSTSTSIGRVDARTMSSANKEPSRSTVVRNLRPRKGSVDYVGTKKKNPPNSLSKSQKPKTSTQQSVLDTTWIKTENVDFEGRTLRPRKEIISYCGPKRKYTKSPEKDQKPKIDKDGMIIQKVRNITKKLKLPSKKQRKMSEDRVKLSIKEEQTSDFEDSVFDESMSRSHKVFSLGDQTSKIDALPTNFLNARNDRVNYDMLNCMQEDTKFNIVNELKSLESVSESKLRPRKVDSDRELRSGKVRKLDAGKSSGKKLQRTLRNIADRGKSSEKGSTKTITDIVSKQKISALIKLNSSNIKHYCEGCNTKFLNKELFALHTCYR